MARRREKTPMPKPAGVGTGAPMSEDDAFLRIVTPVGAMPAGTPKRTRVRKKDFFQGVYNSNTRRVTAFLTVSEHEELKDFLLWVRRQTGVRIPEGVYLGRLLEICTPKLKRLLKSVRHGDGAAAQVEALIRQFGED